MRSEQSFIIHFRATTDQHDSHRRNYGCGMCHYRLLRKQDLKRHMEYHVTAKNQMYVCPICGRSQRTLETLRKHVKESHWNLEKIVKIDSTFRIPDSVFFHFCEFCKMAFSTPDDMERHFKYVHEDITLNELRDYAISTARVHVRVPNQPNTGGSSLWCIVCSETFESYPELQKHMAVHRGHTDVTPVCDTHGNELQIQKDCDSIKSSQLRNEENSEARANSSIFETSLNKQTRYESSKPKLILAKHKFQCEKCDLSYPRLSRLKRHISRTHDKNWTGMCEYCGKIYTSFAKVKAHIQVKHKRIKSFHCDFCNTKLSTRKIMITHMRNHFGLLRKFTCETCGKQYIGVGNYNTHRKVHNEEHICKCGERFRRKQYLLYHEQTKHGENPFICKTCTKTFANPSCLNIHKRIHRDDKRFKCPTCEKSFVQAYSVKVHMRVHTQEKPFHCDKCNAKYSQSYPLTLHKRKHHSQWRQILTVLPSDTPQTQTSQPVTSSTHCPTLWHSTNANITASDAKYSQSYPLTLHKRKYHSQ